MTKLFTIEGEGGHQRRVALAPAGEIGIGGAGCHGAAAARSLRARLAIRGLDPRQYPVAESAMLALSPAINIDTAEFEEITLPPARPNNAPETLRQPEGYERLASPDGLELLAQAETPVARHLQHWPGLQLVAEKRANSEGEGIPLYGCANLLASAGLVWRWVRSLAQRVIEAAGTPAASRLAEYGIEVRNDYFLVNVYAGLSGATGTGSLEILLAMLSLALDGLGARGRAEVRLHLLVGAYHAPGSEEERRAAAARATGLLERLNEYEARRRTVRFGLPDGEVLIVPPHLSYRLADATFAHTALAGEIYPDFIRRVSLAIYHAEIGPRAARLRLTRANAPARRKLFDAGSAEP